LSNTSIGVISGIGIVLILAFVFALFPAQSDDIFFIEKTSSGNSTESTECINLDSGTFIIKNSTSGNCFVRSIVGSGDISISNNSDTVIIDFNGTIASESTICFNVGGQTLIIKNSTSGNCYVKSLQSGTGIIISNGTNTITITNSLPENTSAINLGVEVPLDSANVFKQEVGDQLQFKTIFSHDTNTLTFENWNSTHIRIRNLAPESTTCDNVGTFGEPLRVGASSACDFKRLLGSTGITLTSNSTNVIISSFCTNTGTGEAVCESSNNINSLIAGTGITITDTTGDLTISSTASGSVQIGQVAGQVYLSLAKTNIGTSYIDVYVTAFDEENQMIIECANVTYAKVVYQWDYVGAGTQQLRWVDASNNANVFYESPTFTTDRDATDSGFFVKPSWCVGTVTLEQQGKSTTGTDDPVAKGYKIVVK